MRCSIAVALILLPVESTPPKTHSKKRPGKLKICPPPRDSMLFCLYRPAVWLGNTAREQKQAAEFWKQAVEALIIQKEGRFLFAKTNN
jgi:hypothetical protein